MSDALFDDAEMGAGRPYVVLARKYRPQVFEDLIGQSAMVETLRNAFEAGRIAQGYMLTGVRGVGKTTTARILARALNFERDDHDGGPTVDLPREGENLGRHCKDIMDSRHADVIEMDAASNTGVDNIREIIESARYKPLVARYKVFIIDEVHMLSKGAFNALLKTLEEPPGHVKFIFATTEIRKVPVTVLSRCQRFDLRRVDVAELSGHFGRIVETEGAKADADALRIIARAAGGSVRAGLSILDQAIAFSKGEVTGDGVRTMLGLADRGRVFDLIELCFSGKPAEALAAFDALHRDGADPVQLLTDLAETVHLATRVKVTGADTAADTLSAEDLRRAATLAGNLSVPLLSRGWQMLLKGIDEVSRAAQQAAAAEMVLIRLAYTADLPSPDEIIRSLDAGGVSASNGSVRNGNAPAERARAGGLEGARGAAVEAPERPVTTVGSRTANTARSTHNPPPWDEDGSGGPALRARDPSQVTRQDPFSIQDQGASPLQSESIPSLGEPLGDELEPDDLGGEDHEDNFDPATVDLTPEGLQTRPRSFAAVLDLVGEKRDAKLKYHLEEHVSLVKFDADNNAIDLFLLPDAPRDLPNFLRERLNEWTGALWMVMVSRSPGERPVGEARREAEAAELEALKQMPAVRAALEVFPEAEIAAVRDLEVEDADDDAGGLDKASERR